MAKWPRKYVAPAKVNLYLDVGELRNDGYHDVTTILHALEFGDEVAVEPADTLSVVCEPDVGVAEESNAAYRAARAMGKVADRDPTVAVRIAKRVPHAAGLGGGSADAAALIRALAELWDLDPVGEEAMSAARSTGADVAFALVGGAALFRGRGDRLERTLSPLVADVVLVNPGIPAPTSAVYAVFDREPRRQAEGPGIVADALRSQELDTLADSLFNALAPAAERVASGIGDVRAWLAGQAGVLGAEVAGSGATMFALCHDADHARAIATRARERGWWSRATRTSAHGVREVA